DIPGVDHILQPAEVADRPQNRHQGNRRLAVANPTFQFTVDGIERELAVLIQHQGGRLRLHDLPAQFTANRTAGAGYHYCLTADATLEQRRVRRYRVTTQQVGDIHFLQIVHFHL